MQRTPGSLRKRSRMKSGDRLHSLPSPAGEKCCSNGSAWVGVGLMPPVVLATVSACCLRVPVGLTSAVHNLAIQRLPPGPDGPQTVYPPALRLDCVHHRTQLAGSG